MNKSRKVNSSSLPNRLLNAFVVQVVVLLLLGSLCALSHPVYANGQVADRTISGTVVDAETGEPLAGVNILVSGTTTGTSTDAEGRFRLTVPDDAAVLEVSYIGYVDRDVQLSASRSEYRIEMEIASEFLDEVTVVAYGEQRRSDVTGSIASVEPEDFNQGVIEDPTQLIQGVVAGVNVSSVSGEPGAERNVIIRGVGSLRSGTSPLFVVDGFALDELPRFLNPEDIESIEVLKDASATALYGARAANGVVVITTKKGEVGDTRMSLSATTSLATLANEVDVFSAEKFRQEAARVGNLEDFGGSTDWQDEFTRTAISNNIDFSLSGASSDRFNYFASLSVQNQEGILNGSALDRYSGRLNMTQSALNDRLTVNYRINAVHTERVRTRNSSVVNDMLTLNPTISPDTDFDDRAELNPVESYNLSLNESVSNRILANFNPSIEIVDNLTYELNLGADYSESDGVSQNSPSPFSQEGQGGSLSTSDREDTDLILENILSYQLNRSVHSATFLSGYSYQEFRSEGRSVREAGFINNGVDPRYQDNISTGNNPIETFGSADENKIQSFFGRVNYSYDDRYLLTATMRADGSSRFGDNNKYGYFPSFALGWNVTNERFVDISFLDNLKLRASWGQTGNQAIPNKITKQSFTESRGGNDTYPLDGNAASREDYPFGTVFTRLANPDIQWEVSTQTDIGVDFEMFNSRLIGTFDYYNKVSDNILLETVPADPIQPTSTFWTNVPRMEIRNSGIELSLEHRSNPAAAFRYSIGGNISTVNNEVVDSPFSVLTTGSASGFGQTGATINGYINGEPIGAFYMLEFDGIGEDGLNKFVDRNGDGEILEDDRFVAGNALPNLLFGIQLNLNYRGFGLGLNFNGAAGHDIYNHTAMSAFNRGNLAGSGNTTDRATEFSNEDNGNSNTVSTRYLEDGDYLRLNSATLSYNVSPGAIGLGETIRNLRVRLSGQNLFLITGYSGFDPEVDAPRDQGGIESFGIDYFTYPSARTFQVGLDLAF